MEVPAFGWKQFLTNRQRLLNSFDVARRQCDLYKIQTFHGEVGEAELRNWLKEFLPKKYGVTAGYIISQGIPASESAPHFDVIVYDYLETPVLWVGYNPDNSDSGQSRAIPAENVRAVIEVKSRFNNTTVNEGIGQLRKLEKLMSGIDDPKDPYKLYLPENFFSCLFFFGMDEKATTNLPVKSMLEGLRFQRIFAGGIILRSPDAAYNDMSGLITFSKKDDQDVATLAWEDFNFAVFSFDFIARLNETYHIGQRSSFHAFGSKAIERFKEGQNIKHKIMAEGFTGETAQLEKGQQAKSSEGEGSEG